MLCVGTNKLITNYVGGVCVDVADVVGVCVYVAFVGGACVDVAFVSGVCMDVACVGGACLDVAFVGGACVGRVKKGTTVCESNRVCEVAVHTGDVGRHARACGCVSRDECKCD